MHISLISKSKERFVDGTLPKPPNASDLLYPLLDLMQHHGSSLNSSSIHLEIISFYISSRWSLEKSQDSFFLEWYLSLFKRSRRDIHASEGKSRCVWLLHKDECSMGWFEKLSSYSPLQMLHPMHLQCHCFFVDLSWPRLRYYNLKGPQWKF